MNADQWAIVGILVTILIGLPAYFVAKKVRSNRQNQKVSGDGTGLQAGRDIKYVERP